MRRPNPTSAFLPRRFYKDALAAPCDDGFDVRLDGRPVKTPTGAALVLPTMALARLVAEEWAAQGETIDLSAMTAHRLASASIDQTADMAAEMVEAVVRYAGADVLCHVAASPQALVNAEREGWTPLLDWARDELGVTLQQVSGVTTKLQPAEALAKVRALMEALDAQARTGVAAAAPLFGSAILAFALQRGRLDAARAFALSRLDEAFQEQRWGVDAEAAERTHRMAAEAELLGRWFEALGA